MKPTDGWYPASVWEDQNREVAAAAYGLVKLGVDAGNNIKPGDGFFSEGDKRPVARRPAPKAAPGRGREIGHGIGHTNVPLNRPPEVFPQMLSNMIIMADLSAMWFRAWVA